MSAKKYAFLVVVLLTFSFLLSGCGGAKSASVSVTAAAANVDGGDSTTLTATVTNDSTSAGVTWSVSGAGTLSNTTTSAATFTASAATSSSQSATITATSVTDTSKSSTATITVPATPSVTSISTDLAGTVGSSYSIPLKVSGGIPPYTWTLGTGTTLPSCLTLKSTGVLTTTSGTAPTASCAGTYSNLTFNVTDSGTATALSATSSALSITIAAAPAIAFTGTMPATGTFGATYNGSAAASGGAGALTYTVSAGSLPGGLGLVSTTGAVTGKPTLAGVGTSNFTIMAADAYGDSNTQSYQIVVGYPAVAIAPPAGSLPLAVTGQAYAQALTASGGSGTGYVWTVVGLPANGISYTANGATLNIVGPATTTGPVNFTAAVTDSASNSAGPAAYSIQVDSPVTIPSTIPGTLASTASAGLAYSGTVMATGGSGNYSWTVGGLPTDGLSGLASGGTLTVSGTPASAATVPVTVTVKDTTTGVISGPYVYTINVTGALTLPAPNPSSLPSGSTGYAYTGSVTGSGGSGNLTIAVTTALSPANGTLATSISGTTVNVTGTPATATTETFTVQLTDNTTLNVINQSYSIGISAPIAVSLPAPSATVPGPATSGQTYTGSITALNGVGPYTWSINGVTVTSGGLSLGNGTLSATNSGGSTLSISGTPSSSGTVTLTNVEVVDSESPTTNATYTYSITVQNNGGQISGQIMLPNLCGAVTLPTFTVTINTVPTATQVQTDANGNYSFSNIPAGTYTITPSVPGATSSIFYPASYPGVVVTNSTSLTGENFSGVVGYTVSGTASYTGTAYTAGRVYLEAANTTCGQQGSPGTSVAYPFSSGGAYSIRGVPPGTYTVQAFMDPSTMGQGATNTSDPTASSASFTVSNADVTSGADVTMGDPTIAVPASNPSIASLTPNAGGVTISYSPAINNSNQEEATVYDVNWSTSSALTASGGVFTTVTGTTTFKAIGNSSDVWILDNTTLGSSAFNSSQPYYFQARARNSAGAPSGWTTFGGSTPTGVTIGTPTCTGTCYSVSGTAYIPSTVTVAPGAPLYVGVYNLNTGQVFGTEIAAPTNSVAGNAFTLTNIPSGTGYFLFGILDQNKNGLIDVGDPSNTRNNNVSGIPVTSNLTGKTVTLPGTNSTVQVQTEYNSNSCTGCTPSYTVNLNVNEANKLPVAVTLSSTTAGTPYVITPVDISTCIDCGNVQFEYSANLPGGTPSLGDSFGFTVIYSDGTQETGTTVNGAVTAFGSTGAVAGASDLATGLQTGGTNADQPNFIWTFPANPSNYTYQFQLQPVTCSGNCTIWQIPGNNSNSNGFTYAETETSASTGQITWGTDPTGGSNTPSGSLSAATGYNWSIKVQDASGNSAESIVTYTTP